MNGVPVRVFERRAQTVENVQDLLDDGKAMRIPSKRRLADKIWLVESVKGTRIEVDTLDLSYNKIDALRCLSGLGRHQADWDSRTHALLRLRFRWKGAHPTDEELETTVRRVQEVLQSTAGSGLRILAVDDEQLRRYCTL